jgi:hypothetical protein
MKTKLELKHLAAYLPYGVRTNIGRYSETNIELDLGFLISYNIDAFKLILRPLSDLTKEIEVNGERFVGIEKIETLFNIEFEMDSESSFLIGKEILYDVLELNYVIIEKLFEWHFDVFGLIENDLAIDINSNEY